MGIRSNGNIEIDGDVRLYESVGWKKIGHHIAEDSGEGHIHFLAHNAFENGETSHNAQIIYAYNFTERLIFQPDESGSFTGTLLEFSLPSASHILSSKFYYKTDTTAATEPVRICVWEGTDTTGTLVIDQTYPASEFPASTEIILTIGGYSEYDPDTTYFLRYESDADFSFKMDSTNYTPWLAADTSFLREDDMLSTKAWVDGDSWDSGDYYISDKKIYVCNTTGVQTGTFASNSDKWDLLSSVANDFWAQNGNNISYTDGVVGIGTNNPQRHIHIKRSVSNAAVFIRMEDDDDGTYWELGNKNDDNFGIWNYNGTDLNTSVFTINTDGNVGIGTTDPKSNLHILTSGPSALSDVVLDRGMAITGLGGRNRIYFESLDSVEGEKVFAINNEGGVLNFGSLNDTATVWTNESILALDHDTGNVGIGTIDPQKKLDVVGDGIVRGKFDLETTGGKWSWNSNGWFSGGKNDDMVSFITFNDNSSATAQDGGAGLCVTNAHATGDAAISLIVDDYAETWAMYADNSDGNSFKIRSQSGGDHLTITPAGIMKLPNLPTSDPVDTGALWNDNGSLKISAG